MPPFPIMALIPNSLMKSGSSAFMRAEVVGPAAITFHPLESLFTIGPQ